MVLKSPSLTQQRLKECSYTDSEKSSFHSGVKHHYIFITRRQMTKAEREGEMNQASNNTATRLVSLSVRYLIALFKPAFHQVLLQET